MDMEFAYGSKNIELNIPNKNKLDTIQPHHVEVKKNAEAIIEKCKTAERFLFVDTDVEITRLFSDYYFGQTPDFPLWVDGANRFDLYLFLEIDAPYVEDPQRDAEHMREEFRERLLNVLKEKGAEYEIISGAWDDRFFRAVEAVERRWPTEPGV